MILRPSAALAKAVSAGSGALVLAGSGVVKPFSPAVLARLAKAVRAWGLGPAGGFTMLATRYPDRIGIVDELGEITYGEIHRRSNVLARALAARGVGEGDGVAVMCRNHRGFVEATVAIAKLGADALYLNTAFAGPQLVDVLAREKPRVVIHDEEFSGLLADAPIEQRIIAWTDSDPAALPAETLDALATGSDADAGDLASPSRHGRIIILTSGTTGTPKGAPRNEAGIDSAISLLSRMPLREGWRTHIAAPLFHTWGFAHLMLAMLLGSTMVLRRRFDPADALAVTEGCDSLVVIPVMLQRMLAVDADVDLTRLKVVASSGSALPGDLALEWMDRFGDNLYNIYGSTEVAYASIATPEDLRAAPTSAGRPPWGTVVRILDPSGHEVPQGAPGRIFVGNSLLFEGYTGGGGKEVVDGLMSSGDVGRFGADGRLYVEGRDDEMIVSGGENVFPQEVEDCLARHPAVVEVACVGVDDDEFGKRLRAFVVVRGEVGEDELRGWVKDHLARFKVPREIVVLPELPRNATGKVLKRELVNWDTAGESKA
ncbi:AMP-binding protein [Nocardioides sp. BP30]|uniref:AMP-binding protein n=1 Tax=Nocardioides sp. BP30 TaxID=3036374 RepID=UPI002468F92F|nr:AMP-binding protein [Nocardioides sp. BP30]WGL51074.1 AMP-binding protein [Nocardioides sp. BP30]